MRAGSLRHLMTLEHEAEGGTDAGGDPIPGGWSALATVPVAITPLEGSEALRGMQLEARVTHEVRMRWRAGVTSAMRGTVGTRVFHFRRVTDPDERRRELHIMAEEVR